MRVEPNLNLCSAGILNICTVELPNNESIGTANFFHCLEVFFIERYKSIEEYANGKISL